ncbi:hypothetical protein FHP00_10805 [Escherichia coli]|uniref:hypothetical protein n=1 Tax=Escherichia coli TaxID=562 RepID=UPI000541F38F|nr:hypothetical protein [Escherichia coli]EEV5774320.1 hypothetical protein [Escherichia coli]EEV7371389.1 hypothetical protein [Escherichia coli]EEW0717142.1 hypothetical protein [Escherichia coli]EEX2898290.1 hypothetical protein [Escherichia coli]EEY7922483.1 hypothetical protein [Escherichia coli]
MLFPPTNKKGPPAARKNTLSKAPADAFCVVLSDVMCAGHGADMKKARRSEPVFNECKIQLFLSNT